MNFNKLKAKKHFRTFVCMVAGVMLLSSAVYANYDNASGYSNYKKAVKNLILSEDNYTAAADMTFKIDGENEMKFEISGKRDGDTYSTSETSTMYNKAGSVEVDKSMGYYDGEYNTTYYPETNIYRQYESSGNQLLDTQDKTVQKAINFTELLADTLIGDLKNNFVLVSDENGIREYSVNVSGSQMPEIVNSGLSLMFTAMNSSTQSYGGYVTYENYEKTFGDFYYEKTGKVYSDEDTQNYTDEEWEAFNKINDEFYGTYDKLIADGDNYGIVYVKEDGSSTYYNTYKEYRKAIASKESMDEYNIISMFGEEPYVESAVCNFTLDTDGRILSNTLEGTLAGVDEEGKTHTMTATMNLDVSDYGVSVPDTFDATGKTDGNAEGNAEDIRIEG